MERKGLIILTIYIKFDFVIFFIFFVSKGKNGTVKNNLERMLILIALFFLRFASVSNNYRTSISNNFI